jgi:hypothetical protein
VDRLRAALLGAATDTNDQPTLIFAATCLPNGNIIITVNGAVTLADVHDPSRGPCARVLMMILRWPSKRSEQD